MSVAVVLVAAGRGERLDAGKPKALVHVAGLTLLEHALARAVGTKDLVQLVITATPGFESEFIELASPHVPETIELSVVSGGVTRQDSIAKAMEQVTESAAVILVHDAARAFTPTEVFDRVVEEAPVARAEEGDREVGGGGVPHEEVRSGGDREDLGPGAVQGHRFGAERAWQHGHR